eukprot:7146832-Pyramimonas_sp.AAC.1
MPRNWEQVTDGMMRVNACPLELETHRARAQCAPRRSAPTPADPRLQGGSMPTDATDSHVRG